MARRSLIEQLDEAVEAVLARSDAPLPRVSPRIAPLVRMAAELRELPRENFKTHLKTELERRTSMSAPAKSVATVEHALTPYLAFKDAARAIDFYKRAFGARETMRLADPNGKIGHAEIVIGHSPIMLSDEYPDHGAISAETLGDSPVKIHLYVNDVDALTKQAIAEGAKVVRPVEDQFYGDRSGQLADPFGYTWILSTRKEMVTPEEVQRRFDALMKQPESTKPAASPLPPGQHTLTPYIVVQDAPTLIEFVEHTFNAKKIFQAIGSAGGIHAEVLIADSKLMIGGGSPELSWRGESRPVALHVFVKDTDAVYRRALEAGAVSLQAPVDRDFGERVGGVKDPSGNHWYIATWLGKGHMPEGLRTVTPFLHPLRAEPVIQFLRRAFGAQEIVKHASPDGVVHHAKIKIGDSVLEMSEAHEPYQPMSSTFYLNVPDVDATYRQALAAGATSITEPADQSYGARSGGVKDAFGNEWYLATPLKEVTP
jgi:PhnB protein